MTAEGPRRRAETVPADTVRADTARADIVRADKAHVWHPFTEMGGYVEHTDPLVVVRAAGARLFDADGRSYLDANSSWWVSALGHNHPRLVHALREQAGKLSHCALAGITHPHAAALAAELVAVAPRGLTRVFFSDDGSTAVEAAVKMAVQFAVQNGAPKRKRLLALEGAFHGETVGASSLGGIEVFKQPFAGLLFDCVRVPSPANDDAYEQAAGAIERALAAAADEIAAVVIEPRVQGAAGMRIYRDEYLVRVRAACSRHDVLMIADEVFTGYGRTGPMWACDAAGVIPDVLCTAKGFSGGMLPMAATLTTERVFAGFLGSKDRAFHYGHSFCGNPLGARVAREVLAVLRDEQILEHARPKAETIAGAFRTMGELPGVRRTRALGMIGALDLDGPSGYLADAGWRVYEAARRRGAYLRPLGNVVYVCPPLNIVESDLDELLGIVRESVAEVTAAR